jgi:hypothetical protein
MRGVQTGGDIRGRLDLQEVLERESGLGFALLPLSQRAGRLRNVSVEGFCSLRHGRTPSSGTAGRPASAFADARNRRQSASGAHYQSTKGDA